MGDLVQPGPGPGRILERVIRPVGLHERVLGEVGGHLGLPDHAREVRVDLGVMAGEQDLDLGTDGGVAAGASRTAVAVDRRSSVARRAPRVALECQADPPCREPVVDLGDRVHRASAVSKASRTERGEHEPGVETRRDADV